MLDRPRLQRACTPNFRSESQSSRAPVTIDGALSRADLHAILDGAPVRLDEKATARMRESYQTLTTWLEEDRHVYGASSGVGDLRDTDVTGEARAQLQLNIVRSHCCGVGRELSTDIVRAALALRLATFARGYSGVRPELAEHMVALLNACIHPVVPEFGSVGASGDPVLLAHVALAMIGEGHVRVARGPTMRSDEALALHGLRPLALVPREGLALVNGLDFTIGAAVLLAAGVERLLWWADTVAAVTLDVTLAHEEPFLAEVQRVRGVGRHNDVAARVRHLRSAPTCERHGARVSQDPYCLRCVPQVHGASWTVFDRYLATIEAELTAVIDNPLTFAGEAIRHCGHFHGQELAFAADHMALGLANIANIAQARLSLLLSGTRDLPRMLSATPGTHSGLMMVETTAASLVSSIRALAAPMSIHPVAVSVAQEDHTSMSWGAMRRTDTLLTQVAYVLAAETIAAVAAAGFRAAAALGRKTRALVDVLAGLIGPFGVDRPLGGDIETLGEMMLREAPAFVDDA
jgi:histidine ammonia-lyase